jgi:hypothetical protein
MLLSCPLRLYLTPPHALIFKHNHFNHACLPKRFTNVEASVHLPDSFCIAKRFLIRFSTAIRVGICDAELRKLLSMLRPLHSCCIRERVNHSKTSDESQPVLLVSLSLIQSLPTEILQMIVNHRFRDIQNLISVRIVSKLLRALNNRHFR